MTAATFSRLAAPAALAAAVLGVPADLYHLPMDGRTASAPDLLFRVHGLALMAAMALLLLVLLGLALELGDRAPKAGIGMAFAGTLLVLCDIAIETLALHRAPVLGDPQGLSLAFVVWSFALFAGGWLLVALKLGRRGALMAVGAVLAFTPFPGSYVLLLVGAAVATRAPRPVVVPATA